MRQYGQHALQSEAVRQKEGEGKGRTGRPCVRRRAPRKGGTSAVWIGHPTCSPAAQSACGMLRRRCQNQCPSPASSSHPAASTPALRSLGCSCSMLAGLAVPLSAAGRPAVSLPASRNSCTASARAHCAPSAVHAVHAVLRPHYAAPSTNPAGTLSARWWWAGLAANPLPVEPRLAQAERQRVVGTEGSS